MLNLYNISVKNIEIKLLFLSFNLKSPKKRPIFAENRITTINK